MYSQIQTVQTTVQGTRKHRNISKLMQLRAHTHKHTRVHARPHTLSLWSAHLRQTVIRAAAAHPLSSKHWPLKEGHTHTQNLRRGRVLSSLTHGWQRRGPQMSASPRDTYTHSLILPLFLQHNHTSHSPRVHTHTIHTLTTHTHILIPSTFIH